MGSKPVSEGILTCAKYAFAPNYYRYCGPDANRNIAAYLKEQESDPGLAGYLKEFAVLYPYLKLIAEENRIADPFDRWVVEAYWIGNELLDRVGLNAFAGQLLDTQKLKKKISRKNLKWIIEKVPRGAKIHHSFHVFSIFTRTGHREATHTLNTMDECRIGWGKVIREPEVDRQSSGQADKKQDTEKDKGSLWVKTQKLVYVAGKLQLKSGVVRELNFPVAGFERKIKAGNLVSFHWGFVCEKITRKQAANLAYYTKHNLNLANETL